jgi:hypothetical protein
VEKLLQRYETKEKAEDLILSTRAALAEKADRSELLACRMAASAPAPAAPPDLERRVQQLQGLVDELQVRLSLLSKQSYCQQCSMRICLSRGMVQVQGRDGALGLEQLRADAKRKAVVLEDLADNTVRKVGGRC